MKTIILLIISTLCVVIVFLSFGNLQQVHSIDIENELGQKIFHSNDNLSSKDLSGHSKGLYFLHINSDSENFIKK